MNEFDGQTVETVNVITVVKIKKVAIAVPTQFPAKHRVNSSIPSFSSPHVKMSLDKILNAQVAAPIM